MTSNEELHSCIFCKESFANKEELQVHFRKHGDPKFNQSVKNRVSNDSDACGDNSADVGLVSCDVCSDTFPSISKAITHKHKVHPDHDAKYFCPWCGKLFTMKHLYNKHVETSHNSKMQYESSGFHCDYCDADFFAPSAMIYHNKFFHRQDTELAAIGQSRKLKLFDQEMLPLYYCPFCGEEYFNKVNLHKHMGDDHSDENQSPDDVLRCPLCEAIFYHLDAYELHLMFHSTEDTYSEENEIVKNITEFSLEAVPPIMEKVENETADSETTMNSMGIGEFLQMGMDETADNETGEKRKKKKKHKKSKKSAITLDEFLNMNKDVFGECIDVEGIEEVPTRVVAKRLKTRPQRPKPAAKVVASSEIAKLKKQGIVVKKNLGNAPKIHTSLKGTLCGKPLNSAQNSITNKVTTDTTKPNSTSDVITKLRQTNSQLKIVKKPSVQTTDSDLEKQSNDEDPASVNKEASTEENRRECDLSKSEEHKKLVLDSKENDAVRIASEHVITCNANTDLPKTQMENDEILEKNEDKNGQNKHVNIDHIDEASEQPQEESFCKNDTLNSRVKESVQHEAYELDLGECHGNNKVNHSSANVIEEKNKSLDTLKNLTHLTVKSLNQPKTSTLNIKKIGSQGFEFQDTGDAGKFKNNSTNKQEIPQKPKDYRNLEALKLLSKNITVKSSNKAMRVDKNLCSDKEREDEIDNSRTDNSNSKNKEVQPIMPNDDKTLEALKFLGKNITIKSSNQTMQEDNDKVEDKNGKLKTDEPTYKLESPQKSKDCKNFQPVATNKYVSCEIDQENNLSGSIDDKIHNIQTTVKCSQAAENPVIKNELINSPKINKALLVKVESDLDMKPIKTQQGEDIYKQLPNIQVQPVPKIRQQIATAVSKSSNVSFSKEGTYVKTATKIEEIKEIETFNIDDSDDEDEMRHSSNISNNTIMKTSKISLQNTNSQHLEKLKSLGQQVTIKSKSQQNPIKSSIHSEINEKYDKDCDAISQDTHNDGIPKDSRHIVKDSMAHKSFILQNKLKNLSKHITVKSRNFSPQKIKLHENTYHDSDTEVIPAKVKISELPDDFSDDEFDECQDGQPSNCIVESPEEYSENEECDKNNESDIETQLKSNTLYKPIIKKNNTSLNNLQSISKDVTIKSLQNKNNTEDEYEPESEINSKIANTSKSKLAHRSNYQAAKSSELEHNTANKEVIVKKFGTKTVIEEITTTVTKTIRTVNQTVQQEVTNSSQIMSPSVKCQKIQNIIPRQQVYEGKQVRHATPVIGTRVRSVTPQVRPSIRPTNQIVSVRPGLNIRPSNQRMTVGTKLTSTRMLNAKQPVVGKPLKISPNVVSSSNKRPTSEDSNGPFSCFKKQKESLIPIGNLAEISQCDTSVLYASSQMSKSHVSSTTKIATGNSIMTSSQVNSESFASSEQFTKLANMSGLKVVKTSSAQQASKTEECKMNKSNQNTLEAIERLKMQGVLIKKPRLDENYSENSNSDDDNYDE